MATECLVTFKVAVRTELSEVVGIVGNHPTLGVWDEKKAYILHTDPQQFPIWRNEVPIIFPRGTKLEFKFVILSANRTIWEQLPQNRKYRARYNQVALSAEWNNYEGREVIIKKFKSSICLNPDTLANYTRPSFSKEFDPFQQANNDSEDSVDGFDSFAKEQLDDVKSDSDEEDEERPVSASKRLKKPVIQIDQSSDFPSLYSQHTENPKYKQLRSFNQNDILYEVNEDPLVGIAWDDVLLIATFYLPVVIQKKEDETYAASFFQHSFNLHLQEALKVLNCQKKWFGLLIAFDENGRRIQEPDDSLRDFLMKMNYYPVAISPEDLQYFNQEFCQKLYQPIMNNDVSVSKLAAIDYNDKMYQSFMSLNGLFFSEIQKHIVETSIALISDYRLIPLATNIASKYPRLTQALFYNRLFPHIDNLKLIPFYHELLNNFLQTDIICFSNYDTANQFLQIMRDIYQIEFQSYRGNLAFRYFGREIYVKLQNPGIQIEVLQGPSIRKNEREILIVGVDIYGHQSGVELKLKHMLKFIKENPLIRENPHIRFVQLQLKAIEDDDVQNQRNTLNSLAEQINEYLQPYREGQFIQILEESIESKYRFNLFRQADVYIQTRYSGRHDFYLLEYIELNELPIALISDSSCYHKGCNSVHTFNVFSNKDFQLKLSIILTNLIGLQYQFLTQQRHVAQLDKELIRNNQTNTWVENLYIDAKKANSMISFAKISLRGQEGLLTKVAHSPKFQKLEGRDLSRLPIKDYKQRCIILEFETLLNGKFGIDYKPKHLIQASPHYKPPNDPIIIRYVDQEMLDVISELSNSYSIYVLSNGLYNELQVNFSKMNVFLFAENGFLFRENKDQQWNQLFSIDSQCMNQIRKIFQSYASKTEGAIVNVKESSINWTLRNQEEYAHHIIQDLVDNVSIIIERFPNYQFIKRTHSLEVCPASLNKGMIIELILQRECLQKGKLDFGLVVARGIEDEDIFSHLRVLKQQHKYINESAQLFSVSFGLVPTYANHYITSQKELLQILKVLL